MNGYQAFLGALFVAGFLVTVTGQGCEFKCGEECCIRNRQTCFKTWVGNQCYDRDTRTCPDPEGNGDHTCYRQMSCCGTGCCYFGTFCCENTKCCLNNDTDCCKKDEESGGFKWYYVAIPVIVVVILIAAIVVMVYIRKRRAHQPRDDFVIKQSGAQTMRPVAVQYNKPPANVYGTRSVQSQGQLATTNGVQATMQPTTNQQRIYIIPRHDNVGYTNRVNGKTGSLPVGKQPNVALSSRNERASAAGGGQYFSAGHVVSLPSTGGSPQYKYTVKPV